MRHRWQAYGLALAAVAAAAAVRAALDPLLHDAVPYATFFVAVVAASWFGGLKPALLATLASLLAASYLFVPPRGALSANDADLFGMLLFAAVGFAIAVLGQRMRDAVRRAQRAEDEMRAQQELRVPFELAGVGHTEVDVASGRFLRVNASFCDMTGYSREELLARTFYDITHPEDVPGNREALAPVLAGTRDRFELEKRYVRKDGRVVHARVTSMLVRDAEGRPQRLLGSVVDVNERWRVEQALRESEARFRTMADDAPVMVWVTEDDGRCSFLSRSWYEFTGQAPGTGLGLGWLDSVHPDDRVDAARIFREAHAAQAPFRAEYRLRHRDGSWRWAIDSARPRWDAEARFLGYIGSVIDISDRKHIEEALRASEARFRGTLDHAPVAIAHVGLDGRFALCNPALCELTGYTREELLQRRARDVTHPDDLEVDAELARGLLDRRATRYTREKRLLRRHGESVWVQATVTLIRDEAGRPLYFIGAAIDIGARREANARLRASEERFRQVFEKAATGIAIIAEDGRFLSCNPAWCAIYGRSETELRGMTAMDLVHPDDLSENLARLEHLRSGSVPSYELENRAVRPDGSIVWVAKFVTTLQDEPSAKRFVVLVTDVTFRRRAEAALRENEARYRSLAEGMPHIVWECDPDGSCTFLNRAWHEYTGAAPGSTLGYDWLAYYDPRDAESLAAAWQAALRTHNEIPYDLYARLRRADGVYRWFRVNGAPVLDDAGAIVRWVGTCTDVHDVRELIAALQEADQRKDEFLATLAHELRNPLAPIRNAVEYLKLKGPADPPLVAAREMIERQLAQMVRLIDDLLDVSRITRGKLELRRARVELREVVRHAIETSRPNVEAAGHRLDVVLPDAPVALDADLVRLAQVLANLLNNAAKFTDPGGRIELRAATEGHEAVIRVRDNGIGITPDRIGQVFDMFTQVEHSPTVDRGGLGIGLTLVKRLVEMHGGTVAAASEGPGRGSEFTVRIPLPEGEPASAEPGVPGSAGPARIASARRVLIVDDNRDAAVSLAMVMKIAGCETEVAHDGPAAVVAAERWRPDLVLLDLGLPGMDGHQVCRTIRAQPWGRGPTIVAVTGWGQDEDRRRSHEAGFDGHLVKPVDHESLLALLEHVAQDRERQPVAS